MHESRGVTNDFKKGVAMEAMILMMVFGVALLLTALWLALSKDPRHSVLLYKVTYISSMPREKAREKARQLARVVAIVGLLIIVVFGIGLIILGRSGYF